MKWPSRPWARLHLDFAGPFEGKFILVMIDAHSKWIEAVTTSSTSSNLVIEELRTLFARFGIPESIVTDNGTCFVSEEFESFLKTNGIRHTTSASYHPSSNGLAERAVQIVKRGQECGAPSVSEDTTPGARGFLLCVVIEESKYNYFSEL